MEADGEGSFTKFSYLVRPSKQVERKLVLEALHMLRYGGFDLRQYTYVGLGSIYYADFILFHKYLYIDSMICAEIRPIPKRMRFNKPYRFIRLKMEAIGNVIGKLNRKRPHFVWLDYESGLNDDIAQDVTTALGVMAPGSVLFVTVDAEPDHQSRGPKREDRRHVRVLEEFNGSFSQYVGRRIRQSDLSAVSLPRLLAEIMAILCRRETARVGRAFFPLFNFVYADGAQMFSFGGMVGDESTKEQLEKSGVYELPFVTNTLQPIPVSVPPLTPRERDWLEQNARDGHELQNIRFELDATALFNFRRYRRYYPSYHEALF